MTPSKRVVDAIRVSDQTNISSHAITKQPEAERLDMTYNIIHKAILNKSPLAPALGNLRVADGPLRILDLGCGTGLWCLEMAEKYPDAEIYGVDLINITPKSWVGSEIPRCITWNMPMDIEDSNWAQKGLPEASFGLINLSGLRGAVADWRALYKKVYRHLKPGSGQIQHIEVDYQPRASDPNVPPDTPFHRWWDLMQAATRERPLTTPSFFEQRRLLEEAGFVDVQRGTAPMPWENNGLSNREKKIGDSMKCLFAIEEIGFFEAMMLLPFTRKLGWHESQVRAFADELRRYVLYERDWRGFFEL
ncbi:hypothetical protein MBLNU230_g5500t2 [Neophaeotheca triangularis]